MRLVCVEMESVLIRISTAITRWKGKGCGGILKFLGCLKEERNRGTQDLWDILRQARAKPR